MHEISNDNEVRVVNCAASKNLTVKITIFPHRNIRKYTWTAKTQMKVKIALLKIGPSDVIW
jgi:hypothetical protein